MRNVMFPRECFNSSKDFISTNFIYGQNNPDVEISSCEATFDDKGYATSIKLPANFRILRGAKLNERNTYWKFFWNNSNLTFDLDFNRIQPITAYMCWDSTSINSYINIRVINSSITTAFSGANVHGNNIKLIHIKEIVNSSVEYLCIGTQVDSIIIEKCVNLKRDSTTTLPFSFCNVKHLIVNGWCDQPMYLTNARFERQDMVDLFNSLGINTTTQTLTLGSTLLAKLTDEDKKIATDKGWTLA